jgi:hypothetical protein
MIILSILVVLILGLVIFIYLKSPDFCITRSRRIQAPAGVIFAQIEDFHLWEAWSPWAKMDPQAKNTFDGPATGLGSSFRWEGNNQVGSGIMTVLESRPSQSLRIRLQFLKPFAATNTAEFTLTPAEGGTLVTWSMTGKNNFIAKLAGLFFDCDKLVGGQFEQGLISLQTIAEAAL